MPRKSKEEEVRTSLREYLNIAGMHNADEYPLNVRSVSVALKVSPTTMYKYKLDEEINVAARQQGENAKLTGRALERRNHIATIQDLKMELDRERERNKKLVGQIAVMEANVARLGFDPEEMYKPLLKPVRSVSRAGDRKGANQSGRKHWARSN